jgi:hypothetical protein
VVPRASSPIFMLSAPGRVFGGTEGVGSLFHVLRSRTHFRRYRGRRVRFSHFTLSDSFSAILGALGPVFLFCAPGLVFGGSEEVGSRFHVLLARTRFRRYRVRRFPFSSFALPNSYSTVPTTSGPVVMFSAVQRASLPVFMLSAPAHVFGGTEGVRSRFHVLYYQTRFRRYRGHWVPFSCFARPDSFSAVPKASSLVFMFCAPGLVFGGTEGVGSRFYVLRSRTHFRRYRGRPFPYSCFPLPDMFSAVPRASTLVFMFCTPDSFSAVPRASGIVFVFSAPGLVFINTLGFGSRFLILRARTRFRLFRGRRVPFSCFV